MYLDEPFEIEITKYDRTKGHGTGHLIVERKKKPQKIEVPGSVIGDRLRVMPCGQRHFGAVARIQEVLKPGPSRVAPRCPHVGVCGGCSWQQIEIKEQLLQKEQAIRALFPNESPLSIIEAKDPWFYRNKMEYTFSENIRKERFCGLVIAETKGRVLNLEACFLASPWHLKVLSAIRIFWEKTNLSAFSPQKGEGILRKIALREGKNTKSYLVNLTVSGQEGLTQEQIDLYKEALYTTLPESEHPFLSIFLTVTQTAKGVPTQNFEMHLAGSSRMKEILHVKEKQIEIMLSPSSFFQPNTVQAGILYERLIDLLCLQGDEKVLDLYCGIGSIGIALAPFVERVLGIELNRYAIYDGEKILKANHIENVDLVAADALCFEEVMGNREFDLVIVDPPRAGLGLEVIAKLLKMAPLKIGYVSCNPESQARDIALLKEGGYVVEAMQPVDQFPHTPHVENIAILIKKR